MLKLRQALVCLAIALATPALALKHGTFTAVVTTATDDFNRANGALGTNWVAGPSFAAPTITSNTAGSSSGVFTIAYWNPATNTFQNDQFSQVTMISGSSPAVVVRHQPGVSSGYMALATGLTAGSGIDIYKFTAGSFTLLNSGASFTPNPGDVLKLTVTGTTLVATVNGTTRNTITDATFGSGSPGIGTFNAAVDDWSGGPFSGGSGDVAFSLPSGSTLKFMAPAGHDTCDGLGPSTGTVNPCAWATPNHAMNCGEVILTGPGSYNSVAAFGLPFGTVSNCPSSSGGIDGLGQINFAILLCAGSDIQACTISANGSGQDVFGMSKNNWSIQGWICNGLGTDRCFMADTPSLNTIVHHHAFINNIAYNTGQGFGANDCPGGTCTHNVPGEGFDYWAVVGNIAQNAALAGICLAAIDAVGTANFDTVAGTHIYVYNNYAISNNSTSTGCAIDQEAIMFDTWDLHAYNNQGVAANNIAYNSTRYGFQIQVQSHNTSSPTIKVYNNTFYRNLRQTDTDNADGEINFTYNNNGGSIAGWTFSIINNIAYQPDAASPGGTTHRPIFAAVVGAVLWPNLTFGSTGNENIFLGAATTDPGCSAKNPSTSPYSVCNFDGNPLGTNFIANPTFTNTADLLANRLGVPNCTGFENVTQCMGWDARTSTLTTPSVISDLTATCAQCTGKGFQRPSVTCAANADYPTWLKGIVYLHASGFTAGATITQRAGLVTKPCGL